MKHAWATVPLALAINRREEIAGPNGVSARLGRNPAGPTETTVRILHLEGEGRSILLLHYACHPYCLGGDYALISADFWGYAAEALAAEGHQCLYLNGASGNLSPTRAFGGPASARQSGYELAEAVLGALRGPWASEPAHLAAASRRFSIPYDTLPPLEQLRDGLVAVDKTVRDEEREQPLVVQRIQTAWYEWMRDLEAAVGKDGSLTPQPARISIVRIGEGCVVGLPGELFYEAGRDMVASLGLDPVVVAAYCHGYVGYIPTPESFHLGGYEVEEAHRYTGLWRVSPESTTLIKKQVLALWQSMGDSRNE
jgi:hypothetical protein